MSIVMIIVLVVFFSFIIYILFGLYTIKAECAVRSSDFYLILDLSSFLNIFGLKITLTENRPNFEFILCRQSISHNIFIRKSRKMKREKQVKKVSKYYKNIKNFRDSEHLTLIKRVFSALNIKNSKIKLIFGSEDPYITGMVSAWVFPVLVHFDSIHFKPEFQERTFIFIAEVIFSLYIYKILLLFLSNMIKIRFKDFKTYYHK